MRKKTKVKYILLAAVIAASNCIIPRLKTTKVLAANPDEVQRTEESLGAVDGYVEEKKITLKVRKEVVDTLPKDKFDIEILIDASGSMNNDIDPGALKAKSIINNFIDGRDVNLDNIGVSIFRGPSVQSGKIIKEKTAETVYSLGNNFDSAKATITNAYVGGFTPLLDGLKAAKADLDNNKRADSTRKVMIILGDGHPNIGPERNHFYKNGGDYLGSYQDYYPGMIIKNQIDALYAKYDANEITSDEYYKLYSALEEQQNLYPGGVETSLSMSGTDSLLKGSRYDNSKVEYYDLKYLIEQEMKTIKAAGYEVYTIFLNNEKPNDSGYVAFLANTNESEDLFKKNGY